MSKLPGQGRRRRRSVLVGGLAVAMLAAVAAFVGSSQAAQRRSASVPQNTVQPTISGKFFVGETLTATNGTWTNSPTRFTYQWQRCNQTGTYSSCAAIPGATKQTYATTSADQGHALVVAVTASNASGGSTALSRPSPAIAARVAPVNVKPPTIVGTAAVGQTLTADPGTWSGYPTFTYQWQRCDSSGGSCSAILGATASTYALKSVDAGNTLRVEVTATNPFGIARATTVPTAVITTAPVPAATGCPKATAGATAVDVTAISPPARLQLDQFQASPGVIRMGVSSFTVRFHVSDTCGQPVRGAFVYATAVPYNQVTIPPEQATDSNGWVTLTFHRMAGFPAARNQQLMVFFVRAREPNGSNILAGISTRRLISIPVSLHG